MKSDFTKIYRAYYYTLAVLVGKSPKAPKPDKKDSLKEEFLSISHG